MAVSIEAKVAAVISDYEVAFSVGEGSGVKEGDLATLYRLVEVKDPDSFEPLGVIKRPAIRFEIIEVQAKVCVGQTFESVAPEAGDAFTSTVLFGSQRRRVTGNPAEQDRRTAYIEKGAPVTIDRPPREKVSE